MAADLNPPEAFSLPKQPKKGGMDAPQLVPPSHFETPPAEDPWTQVRKLTRDVLDLRTENQQLRQARTAVIPTGEEIRARVDLHKSGNGETTRHLQGIIDKQINDIVHLKAELTALKAEHSREVQVLQQQVSAKDRQLEDAAVQARRRLEEAQRKHQDELHKIKVAHEEEVRGATSSLSSLQKRLEENRNDYEQRLAELEDQIYRSTLEKEELQEKVRTTAEELQSSKSLVSQLRAHLTQMETDRQAAEQWKQERGERLKKIQDLEVQVENLRSTEQLLNVRLASFTDILSIQEADITKSKSDGSDMKKRMNSLLTRWREKVFALMVQLMLQEIVHKKDIANYKQKVADLEDQLNSSTSHSEVLSHMLADRTAELQMERSRVQTLQAEVTSTQDTAVSLQDKLDAQVAANGQLADLTKRTFEAFAALEEKLQAGGSRLTSFSQRLNFAVGRLDMLQGLFARRDAMWRMKLEESTNQSKEEEDQPEQEHNGMHPSQLQEELDRVRKERDQLANQMREDSQLLDQRMAANRQKLEGQLKEQQETIVQLHKLMEEKSQKCQSLGTQLSQLEDDIQEANQTIDGLKTELAKQQIEAEKAVEDRGKEVQAGLVDQLAEMERKVNDARREHTKAVVQLRQAERQAGREKERGQQQLHLQEQHYQRQLHKLQEQLREVDRDRNMLMATLRQEGLIGQYKQHRAAAAKAVADTQPQGTEHTTGPGTVSKQQPTGTSSEPLSSVVEDLRSLTATVLGEGGDTDSSED
ncbi:PREDICTED: coiled-coil alpha-helical rod protein 1-like [Branchiostoma belcheri]|uniref:Coiled-coil alpha-helical rod protein 1 n=1 Tax=Branchiostoma belcheri TaxID=7741 RepID=A0A6P4YJV4_BRABE|nr:PREDICTED: coiled-coil alpha-helical rod protein 1-like [Branchiostoma belcheri]